MTRQQVIPTPPSPYIKKAIPRMKQSAVAFSNERRRRQDAGNDWQWCSAHPRERPLRCFCRHLSRSPMRASSILRHHHPQGGTPPTPTSTKHSSVTSSPPEALHLPAVRKKKKREKKIDYPPVSLWKPVLVLALFFCYVTLCCDPIVFLFLLFFIMYFITPALRWRLHDNNGVEMFLFGGHSIQVKLFQFQLYYN